jgi:hypothetical protein
MQNAWSIPSTKSLHVPVYLAATIYHRKANLAPLGEACSKLAFASGHGDASRHEDP